MADEIRALTVKQPWAWAIASAGKTVENRGWETRYRGLLAIHAGKAIDREGLDDPRILQAICDRAFQIGDAPSRQGAVIAVAELAGCHGPDDCRGTCSPWAVSGRYHWNLFDARPLPEPVPCRGALGLWRLPADVEKAVRAQLEVPGA